MKLRISAIFSSIAALSYLLLVFLLLFDMAQLHGSLYAVCYEYLFLLASASIPVGITKECLQSRGYSENKGSFNFGYFSSSLKLQTLFLVHPVHWLFDCRYVTLYIYICYVCYMQMGVIFIKIPHKTLIPNLKQILNALCAFFSLSAFAHLYYVCLWGHWKLLVIKSAGMLCKF